MIVALQKCFSHPSLVIYFFGTPLIKLECIYEATTNSKSPGPIIMFDQSKTGTSTQIVFITRFSSRCAHLLHIVPASANCTYMQEQNRHFGIPCPHIFCFSKYSKTYKGLARLCAYDYLTFYCLIIYY
jgi:hypothetical protein